MPNLNEVNNEHDNDTAEELEEVRHLLERVNPKKVQLSDFYKKAAISFVVLTFLLVGFILFFSLPKAQITVIPNQETINVDFRANLGEAGELDLEDVFETKVSGEKEFTATGSRIVNEGITGTVTIINNYSRKQPLVKTTRLLTPDDQLFRINETITVMPGESVDVEVYADDPQSIEGTVGATKFTIPGLWEGLQEDIFARSDSPMKRHERVVLSVSQEDLENAQKSLKNDLFQEALDELESRIKNSSLEYSEKLIANLHKSAAKEVLETKVTATEGEEVDNFTLSMDLRVTALVFNESEILEMAKNKISERMPDDKELVDYNMDKFDYLVEEYDITEKTATIRTYLEATVFLKEDVPFLDKDKMIGLSKDELTYYLLNNKAVRDVNVEFWPFWVNKVPKFDTRVDIRIEK